jgi:hypothetical protein
MPFASEAQKRFMYAQHPEIAKRWSAEEERGGSQHFRPSPTSESNESLRSGVKKLPRLPGVKRDFAHLRPSQSTRHPPAGSSTPNEREAMQEAKVQFVHGSRHTEFGVPRTHTGLRGRDVRAGERAIVAGGAGSVRS